MDPDSDLNILLINSLLREMTSHNPLDMMSGLNLLQNLCSREHAATIAKSLPPCLTHREVDFMIPSTYLLMMNAFSESCKEKSCNYG